jgi:hypothetical protein
MLDKSGSQTFVYFGLIGRGGVAGRERCLDHWGGIVLLYIFYKLQEILIHKRVRKPLNAMIPKVISCSNNHGSFFKNISALHTWTTL